LACVFFISAFHRFYPFISFNTPPVRGLRSSYRKVQARNALDFALAGVALAFVFSGDRAADSRLVLFGAAPVPWRSVEAEEVLKGTRLNQDRASKNAGAAVKNAKPMTQNEYKIPFFRDLIEHQLVAIAQPGSSWGEGENQTGLAERRG
jgi:xanthine dehydrogenase YagS FAD-binding subunit